MALSVGVGNAGLQSVVTNARSNYIRSGTKGDRWKIPEYLHRQVGSDAKKSISLLTYCEKANDCRLENHEKFWTFAQLAAISANIVRDNETKFENLTHLDEKLECAAAMVMFWSVGLLHPTHFEPDTSLTDLEKCAKAYNDMMEMYFQREMGYNSAAELASAEKYAHEHRTDDDVKRRTIERRTEDVGGLPFFSVQIAIPPAAGDPNRVEFDAPYIFYGECNQHLAGRFEVLAGLAGRALDYYRTTGALDSLTRGADNRTALDLVLGSVSAAQRLWFTKAFEKAEKISKLAAARFFVHSLVIPLTRSFQKHGPLSPNAYPTGLRMIGCEHLFYDACKSAGIDISAIEIPDSTGDKSIRLVNVESDEGRAVKRMACVCMGSLGYSSRPDPGKKRLSENNVFTLGLSDPTSEADVKHIFVGASRRSKRDTLMHAALQLTFDRGYAGLVDSSSIEVAKESTIRLREFSLLMGAWGHAFDLPAPPISTSSSALRTAATEIAAVESAEGVPSIMSSEIFRDKTTKMQLRPSETVINAIKQEKERARATATIAKVTIKDLNDGTIESAMAKRIEDRQAQSMQAGLNSLQLAMTSMDTFKEELTVTKEWKRKKAENDAHISSGGSSQTIPNPGLFSEDELLTLQQREIENSRALMTAMNFGQAGSSTERQGRKRPLALTLT